MLYEDLSGYLNQNIYPMHMPGNKRRLSPYPGCPVHLDFTEVPGTDDLHHAKGILRDSMERAAQLFGADRTLYCQWLHLRKSRECILDRSGKRRNDRRAELSPVRVSCT